MEVLMMLLAILLVAVVWFYNRLVAQRNRVAEAWAGIDVQLQRRHELVPNLVQVVRGYARHEAQTLEAVTMQRSGGDRASPELAGRETELSRSLGRLLVLAEAYPELKADENFRQLQDDLVEVEDHLQYARRYYNGTVRDLNNLVESFPSNLVARPFGFHPAVFFEIELASQRRAPDVRL
jgi:LemA protein